MKKKLTYLLCGSFMACALVSAQDKQTEKAQKKFENHSYVLAIESYESLVEKGYTQEQIYKNLGEANYQNANYTEAANWFSKLFKLEDTSIDADYMYKYAQSLKSSKEYEASSIWMEKYSAAKSADVRAKKIAANPDYLEKIEKSSGRYAIKNLPINSAAADFAPAFKDQQLVFSTTRDSGTVSRFVHSWNNEPFANLYSASVGENDDFGAPAKLSTLNKKTHETSAVFTKDGSTVYFTRNNSQNGKFSRDDKGVSRLKIYRAKLIDGGWKNIVELPFNGDDYSAAHPTLSPDERKLYFASDMPGTIGASDIFVVNLNEDGSIGTPENLGNTINTEARETFPFVTDSNVLYFASDGHPGLGGLDVFATSIENMDELYIVNTGKPVNSEQDDFGFIINDATKKGFFSSNRDGGQGGDDIYGFTENEIIDLSCNTVVDGVVKDKETNNPLANAKVSIFNKASQLVAETTSAADGTFSLEGDCKDGDYKLVAVKEEYDQSDKMFATVGSTNTSGVEIALEKSLKQAQTGADLVKFLALKPVYFDLDKAYIRTDAAATLMKVVAYMNEFPSIKIQVESHTDVKAGKTYNARLSQRRAENTIAFLVANGIAAERLSGEGFGESRLANDCTTREKCTDEEHEQNRRSEFIVVQ